VTEVNGLRLAYRGFIAGLVGAYVWVAIAMLTAIPAGAPTDPVVTLGRIGQQAGELPAQQAFVIGLALAQVVGAGVGIGFAYFFARFFTMRGTLGMAAVCVAVLAWALLSNRFALALGIDAVSFGTSAGLLAATVAYGWVLGSVVPVRGEVSRSSGSPST
jgi:hypothetical protein